MSYDPGEEGVGDDVPFTLDALNLKDDTSLQHFLSSLEELIGHGQKEHLLLSALGSTRDIDNKLLEEAKVPIYQKKPAAAAADEHDSTTSASASTDTSTTTSPAATPTSASSSSASAAPLSLTKDSKQAELIAQKKLEAELRKKAEKKEKMKKWLGPLAKKDKVTDKDHHDQPASTNKSTTSTSSSASSTNTSNGNSSSSSAGPSACTLLITNLALYILPPAIPMDVNGSQQYFLILNQYQRIALQDIMLLSLPYRSGISLSGGDYALRINDCCVHLRSGRNFWLQSPKGRRSAFVEVLSDAYRALLNHSVQMDQPDYLQLVEALMDGSIVSAMKQMRLEFWATWPTREQGWLLHRSIAVRPPEVTSPTHTSAPVFEHEHDRDSWSMRWFVLSADNYLLQFTSPAELEAFRLVISAADSAIHSSEGRKISAKLPIGFDCIEIDLTRATIADWGEGEKVLPGSSADTSGLPHLTAPAGFEILVFPRDEVSGSPVYDKGHTRHLFTVIPPFSPQMQASWKAGDSPQQLLQELVQHYSKKPSVVIPVSAGDEIDPPSPASAQLLQSQKQQHGSSKSANSASSATSASSGGSANGAQSTQLVPYYPSGHPMAGLRFSAELGASLRASTMRWLASVDDAIHFNQMGGTRSAEDSVGARAAVKGRGKRDGTRSPYSLRSPPLSPASGVQSPQLGAQSGEGNGLFQPMVSVPTAQEKTVEQVSAQSSEAGGSDLQ